MPLWPGAHIAVYTTLVSPIQHDGQLRTYPKLGLQVGGLFDKTTRTNARTTRSRTCAGLGWPRVCNAIDASVGLESLLGTVLRPQESGFIFMAWMRTVRSRVVRRNRTPAVFEGFAKWSQGLEWQPAPQQRGFVARDRTPHLHRHARVRLFRARRKNRNRRRATLLAA